MSRTTQFVSSTAAVLTNMSQIVGTEEHHDDNKCVIVFQNGDNNSTLYAIITSFNTYIEYGGPEILQEIRNGFANAVLANVTSFFDCVHQLFNVTIPTNFDYGLDDKNPTYVICVNNKYSSDMTFAQKIHDMVSSIAFRYYDKEGHTVFYIVGGMTLILILSLIGCCGYSIWDHHRKPSLSLDENTPIINQEERTTCTSKISSCFFGATSMLSNACRAGVSRLTSAFSALKLGK